MESNYVDRKMPHYTFFKEKEITINALKYKVLDVMKVQTRHKDERSWEVQLVCHEVNGDGTSRYGARVCFLLTGGFLLYPSVIVHEMESLEFNSRGSSRMTDLIGQLVQNMPYNKKLSKRLMDFHAYRFEGLPQDEKLFTEIKEFVSSELTHLK